MRFLDFFINTCLLFLTLFSSATRSFINDTDSSNTAPSTVVTHLHATKQTSTTSKTTIKEAIDTIFISNTTTQVAIPTTSSLTVQTTSTTTQPPTTNMSSYTSQTSTPMTTTTSNTTQPPTTNIPSQTTQTFTASTTTSNTTTKPTTTDISTNATQTLTSTTTTTSNSKALPSTNISSHTKQTSTATTTTNKTTKQPSNTFTHTTETSTPIITISRNSTEPITTNISSHTSQHSTPTSTKTSNSTELPTTIIYSYTSQTSTPMTTATSNITQTPNTNISSHTLQTSTPTTTTTSNLTELPTTNISSQTTQASAPTTTTTSNSTELPTTNISSQTTQASAPTTTTNSNTTILSTASPSTQTSLLTTALGQALTEETITSANIPNQTTRESSNATTEEHIMNNSESTTSTENETSQRTSTQTKTTKISSSTSSYSTTPLTTNSRTTTSRTSVPQTTVNPVRTTFTLPNTTLVPTEMLSLGINNTLRLQFTMLITMNRNGSENFNETLFSYMLVRYVFVGYEVIPTVYASNPPSKNTRYRRDETGALFIIRTVRESNSNHESNYDIIANIPVIKLREQSKTMKEFASDISNNIRHNISNITSPDWQAVNTSDEIEKQLKSQTKRITECHASGKLCPLGYDCCPSNEDHYTGICVHRCDLEKKECKNNGHCIFDSMINKTACSCQSTWISLYYGSNCEEQTGKLETVIGFTLGSAVLVIVLVFTAVLCCIRNRDGVKEFRRHDDKSALESDFLSESGGVQIMDLNYRKSTKFNPSSLDVDPVLKTLDPGPADVNVSEILETSGCSTISSSNSNKTFKEDENKHQESTMSRDSDARKPEDNNYVPTNFQSTCPPASTPEISRVSMKPKQENRTNNRQTSFLFGP